MEIFSWQASYFTRLSGRPRFYTIEFGDAYDQRLPKGGVDTTQVIAVFDRLPTLLAKEIEQFLADRAKAGEPFLYDPPVPTALPRTYKCDKWQIFSNEGEFSIHAVFREAEESYVPPAVPGIILGDFPLDVPDRTDSVNYPDTYIYGQAPFNLQKVERKHYSRFVEINPLLDYALGPQILHDRMDEEDVFSTPWAVWYDRIQIRMGQYPKIYLPSSNLGFPVASLAGVEPWVLSMCFDSVGYEVIAAQTGPETIKLQFYIQTILNEINFTGKSPVVFYNGNLISPESKADAVVFYLKEAGTEIYARFLRNDFETEYVITPNLPQPLESITGTHVHGTIATGRWQQLDGYTRTGSWTTFYSIIYPPPTQVVSDVPTVSGSLASGFSRKIAVYSVIPSEFSSIEATLVAGIQTFHPPPGIIDLNAGTDLSEIIASLVGGEQTFHPDPIIINVEIDEASEVAVTLVSGWMFNQVVRPNDLEEGVSMVNTLVSGSYTLA